MCLFCSEYSFTYDTLSHRALYPRHKLHSRWVTPRPRCLWSSMWFSLWVCTLPSLFPHPRFILFVCLLSFFLVTKVNKVPGVLEIHANGLISSSHAMLSIPIYLRAPTAVPRVNGGSPLRHFHGDADAQLNLCFFFFNIYEYFKRVWQLRLRSAFPSVVRY